MPCVSSSIAIFLRNAAHLVVVCVLRGVVEGRRSELMLGARCSDAVAVRGRRGVADMLVGLVEGCRLHVRCGRGGVDMSSIQMADECVVVVMAVVVVGECESGDERPITRDQ